MVSQDDPDASCRYFVSYSGVQLPLNLVQPLEPSGLNNRNTYFRAWYNAQGQLVTCEKSSTAKSRWSTATNITLTGACV